MMKRKLLKSLLIVLLLLVVSVATVIILYTYTPVIDNAILKVVNNLVGNDVKIRYDRIEGNLLGHIRLVNVEIEFQNISYPLE